MRRIFPSVVILALLLVVSSASAATVPVTQLSGDFAATNPSVASTNDGVQYGVYANGGLAGGSLYYGGANGLTLNQITALGYTESHNTTDNDAIAAPYLRIFTETVPGDCALDPPGAGCHDVIFDATECATGVPDENVANHYNVVGSDVRYDDDSCDGVPPDQQPWADVIADHGTDVIAGIYISVGFTGGEDLSALVTDLTVNANTFCFTCKPPVPGPVVNTTFVNEPPKVNIAASQQVGKCDGDSLRKLHAPKRDGLRFLSTRATLRGKKLKVTGRTILVDLRRQPEGNYNVTIKTRYRRHNGLVVTYRTTRNPSVVCT